MTDRKKKGAMTPIELSTINVKFDFGTDWFGPLQPLKPMAPPSVAGREFDYPIGYNAVTRPRAYDAISFHELRNLAESCDILRAVIETRKDQLAAQQWAIKARDKADGRRAAKDVEAITAFLQRPDKRSTWSTWLRMLLEDLFVLDAPALYVRRTRGGQLYALETIDGATIKRVIDSSGRTPYPPSPAYQQVLKGMPAVDYTTDELIYAPRNQRAHKVYGFGPVEQIIMTVSIALRRQVYQLNYYTEGNVPEALIGVPETWNPDQIKQFQTYWDAMLEGNLQQRRHAKFVPGGVAKTFIPTKEPELTGVMDEWLARVVCFAFSISPLPFIKMMNRATADTASDTAAEEGLFPIRQWTKELIDGVIADPKLFNAPHLEFVWRDNKAVDPKIASDIRVNEVESGIITRNEARHEEGREPVPGGDRLMVKTATGYVPIPSEDVESIDTEHEA